MNVAQRSADSSRRPKRGGSCQSELATAFVLSGSGGSSSKVDLGVELNGSDVEPNAGMGESQVAIQASHSL